MGQHNGQRSRSQYAPDSVIERSKPRNNRFDVPTHGMASTQQPSTKIPLVHPSTTLCCHVDWVNGKWETWKVCQTCFI